LVSCEDAQGDYLTVLYTGQVVAANDSAWERSIGERAWHDEKWGDDVTSYAWGPGGEWLYVATSDTYGTGAVYLLDLRRKSSVVVVGRGQVPDSLGVRFEIREFDSAQQRMTISREADTMQPTVEVVDLKGGNR
jgi:hypothetical protein